MAPDNAYRYNGKELDEATGHYFYGFRMYDPAIARFTGVDPIADQFAFVSPYNYAENTPINAIDLHGLQALEMMSGQALYDAWRSGGSQAMKETHRGMMGAHGTGVGIGASIVTGGVALEAFGPSAYVFVATNPETAATAGGIVAGLGTDENLPGAGDDLGRGIRHGVKALTEVADEAVSLTGAAIRSGDELIEGAFDFSNNQTVDFLGNVSMKDGAMEITEAVFYPRGTSGNELANQFGGRAIIETLDALKNYAKENGATSLRLQFQRATNSSSANPGKTFDKIWDLE